MRTPLPLLSCLILVAALTAQAPSEPSAGVDVPASIVAGRGLPDDVLFDMPHQDGPLWAMGHRWKGSFDARGAVVIPFFGSDAPQNFPVRFALQRATVGGEAMPLTANAPTRDGATVRTDRGALTEVISTSIDRLEQSFVFASLPRRGAVAVELDIGTTLAATVIRDGVRFANEFGHVDYTHAVATDAAGRSTPLTIEWTGAGVRMEIPAAFVAAAELPLVLDPVLNFSTMLGSYPAQLQRQSDVASFQAVALGGRTLLVYRRQYSATDNDCWGVMFDGGLGLVRSDFSIDFTTDDWLNAAVAACRHDQNFLVVAEVRIPVTAGSQHYIAGRLIDSNGVPAGVFDIERTGVVGLAGDDYVPDVGSDPAFGAALYMVVFQKNTGSSAEICLRIVTSGGVLTTTNAIAVSTSAGADTRPSVSKSCGLLTGPETWWLVTWQHTYSATDEDIHGRFLDWDGSFASSVFTVTASTGNDTAPSSSSPIEHDGVRYWPVCYEYATAPGQPRDVLCRLIRTNLGTQATFTVSSNVPGADDREPDVDSDGTRFVTILTTGTAGAPQGIEAVTTAWLPSSNTFRVDQRSSLNTSPVDDHGQGSIWADFSGGPAASPHYFLSFSDFTSNTFDLVDYGGFAGTTQYFTTVPTQCGGLWIQSGGMPAIGQQVNFLSGLVGASGTIFGVPGQIPLNALGCNCTLGVADGVFMPNPLYWTVPNDPRFVGIQLAVQGWTLTGSQCLGAIDLSDTIIFTIR
ncbi:MAG: hypothetical protein H6835_17430 [Planctomycetes bacterium]|nr:hypothetical protein [Planctomycetota bacterium]